MSLENIKQALKPKVKTDPAMTLPEAYKDFLKVFSYKEVNKLPLYCLGVNHNIYMQAGTQPPAGPVYGKSRNKLQVLKKYLEDNLSKGFIWTSSSPAFAPVLFVKKPGSDLWFCVNYCNLNTLIIKNRYPLPLIRKALNWLYNVVYFIKLNVVVAFNKIRIAAGKE